MPRRPPLDSFGFTGVLSSLQHTLQWSGEIMALIPTKTMALIRDRLFAEASIGCLAGLFLVQCDGGDLLSLSSLAILAAPEV